MILGGTIAPAFNANLEVFSSSHGHIISAFGKIDLT
jgi:hypothetical protein